MENFQSLISGKINFALEEEEVENVHFQSINLSQESFLGNFLVRGDENYGVFLFR